MLSFFKINLWVAILLAFTLFSGICVEDTTAFTAPAPATGSRIATRQIGVERPRATAFRLASSVVDAPTKKPKGKVEIKKKSATESEAKNGKNGWEIQLFNDPFNHRTFVAKCLCTICGKSDGESYQIMMQAHKNGMGVVGRYHYEVAELYHQKLNDEGLTVKMVEVDDE